MGNLVQRKRQRRQYLWRKGNAYAEAGLIGLLLVPGFILTALCMTATGIGLFVLLILHSATALWIWLVLAGATGVMFWLTSGLFTAHLEKQQAINSLRYVPPVNTDTLPAEEVLVRASDSPPVAQKDLLRAATSSPEEESGEHLLRSLEPEVAEEDDRDALIAELRTF